MIWPSEVRAAMLRLDETYDWLVSECGTSYAEAWRELAWRAETELSDGRGGTGLHLLCDAGADILRAIAQALANAGYEPVS